MWYDIFLDLIICFYFLSKSSLLHIYLHIFDNLDNCYIFLPKFVHDLDLINIYSSKILEIVIL